MPQTRLYIGNLPYRTTADDLRELFSQVGEVVDVAVPIDRETGRPRGFAFVEMVDAATAQQAITQFDGYTLLGRQLRVNESQPRGNSYGGRGSSSNDGGGRSSSDSSRSL